MKARFPNLSENQFYFPFCCRGPEIHDEDWLVQQCFPRGTGFRSKMSPMITVSFSARAPEIQGNLGAGYGCGSV
ncbi:MAG: hypothetical protein Ct9H90mP9_6270 [Pseudomonadota bacterium]|nr:MAG: hypothetical protein Ct9H90mP9_6270 [Pseudomonadota bacterium]